MSSDEECFHENREKFMVERASEKKMDAVDSDFFGPALPPHLLEKQISKKEGEEDKMYGPTLPDNLQERNKIEDVKICDSDKGKEKSLIGPEMPEYFKSSNSETVKKEEELSDEADEAFGPSTNLMVAEDATNYYTCIGRRTSPKKAVGESSVEREEWMTQLPAKKTAALGLFSRQFKTRVQTDKESDSSVWTDTPLDKDKKDKIKDHKEILEMNRLKERDKEMEKLVKKAEKKLRKKESLLEIYCKEKRKKKKKEAKEKKEKNSVPERRPFDRDIDLQVRKFDPSKARAILNRNQFLKDRFAPGQSKFL